MYWSLFKVGSPLNFHSNMLELGKESPKMEIFHGLPLGSWLDEKKIASDFYQKLFWDTMLPHKFIYNEEYASEVQAWFGIPNHGKDKTQCELGKNLARPIIHLSWPGKGIRALGTVSWGKRMHSFGIAQMRVGGRAQPRYFGTFSRSVFLDNKSCTSCTNLWKGER